MSARRRRLPSHRTRVLVAILVTALGVLVATAAGTAFFARNTAADLARRDLQSKAPTVASQLTDLANQFSQASSNGAVDASESQASLNALRSVVVGTLRIGGGVVIAVR